MVKKDDTKKKGGKTQPIRTTGALKRLQSQSREYRGKIVCREKHSTSLG